MRGFLFFVYGLAFFYFNISRLYSNLQPIIACIRAAHLLHFIPSFPPPETAIPYTIDNYCVKYRKPSRQAQETIASSTDKGLNLCTDFYVFTSDSS